MFGFSRRLEAAAAGRPDAGRPALSTQAVRRLSESLERPQYGVPAMCWKPLAKHVVSMELPLSKPMPT